MSNPLYSYYPPEDTRKARESGYWNDDTLDRWLARQAEANPDKHFVEMAGRDGVSYAELNRRATRFAGALAALGCRKGDVIAIQLYNCPDFLTAYLGIARLGAIAAPLHMPLRDAEISPLLFHSKAKAVVCAPRAAGYDGPAMMARLQSELPELAHVIVADTDSEVEQGPSLAAMVAAGAASPPPAPPQPEDPFLLCFTSGTSSAPKGVMRDYQTLTANARTYAQTMKLDAESRAVIVSPLTHVYGLEGIHAALYTGGRVTPVERYDPQIFAEILENYRPRIVYCAPAHVAAALKDGSFDGRDLSGVGDVIVAGSLCPPYVARDFERLLPNGRVGSLFGMTEVLIATQTAMDGDADIRHGTVGRVLPGVEARIVDDEGRSLAQGEVGELQLRSLCGMTGYMANVEANENAYTADGWFRTADLAEWVDGENIAIRGRLNDIINRGGVKINPSDIENALSQHPKVREAALVPVEDEVLGERICAVVTLVNGAELSLDEVTAHLSEKKIAKMRWPEKLIVIDEMPMTPTKKIIKGKVRELISKSLTESSSVKA
ncbi:MAG: class I adenylate-forming enzyme family protein [Rhodovibrionaceae bacterium]